MISDNRVLVGISGGIAIYKTCNVVRLLTEMGMAVDVVMTASAAEFVRPVTFEALSKRPVLASLWERGRALAHINLGQDAQLILIAPATANLLAKAAHGIADDLLTSMLVASDAPVLVAPAMNDKMWAHPATRRNVQILEDRNWEFVGPAVGGLAEGPSERPGRMVEPEELIARVVRKLRAPSSKLRGKRVLVTAGPTRERIDPVRVISNPSSGRMGFAVAQKAFARGADVVLLTGPTLLPIPHGVESERVETTEQLHNAVANELPKSDVLVMAAAPADYQPAEENEKKVARTDGVLALSLRPTADILEGTMNLRPAGSVVVGFALESDDGLKHAREKLVRKRLDLIVLNMAGEPGAGFETLTNRVTLVTKDEDIQLPVLPKEDVAERILDRVEELL